MKHATLNMDQSISRWKTLASIINSLPLTLIPLKVMEQGYRRRLGGGCWGRSSYPVLGTSIRSIYHVVHMHISVNILISITCKYLRKRVFG